MLKSVISSLVALVVVATPVAAEARNGHHRGYDRHNSYRGHHRGGVSTGEAIAIGMGALILGAAVASSNRQVDNRPRDYDYRYEDRRPNRYCREVISSGYDRYGDYYETRTIRC